MDFKSQFEEDFAVKIGTSWEYEPCVVEYVQPAVKRKYTPDFAKVIGRKVYFLECKGRFRVIADAKKYIHIKAALDPHEELVFILSQRNTKMPGKEKRERKDGSRVKKETMEAWLTRHGIRWFYAKDFKEEKL